MVVFFVYNVLFWFFLKLEEMKTELKLEFSQNQSKLWDQRQIQPWGQREEDSQHLDWGKNKASQKYRKRCQSNGQVPSQYAILQS